MANTPDGKVCSQCGIWQPLDNYSPDKRARDGHYSACRQCNKMWRSTEYHREYRAKNAKRLKENRDTYQRANSETIKYRDRQRYAANSDPKRQRERRRYEQNPGPVRARARAWNSANPKRKLLQVRAWQRANPDRTRAQRKAIKARRRAAEGRFTGAEWLVLCERYGNICLACGGSDPLTPDHVIPLSRGGLNTIDNIQPLCLSCNIHKGTRIIDYRPDYCRSKA